MPPWMVLLTGIVETTWYKRSNLWHHSHFIRSKMLISLSLASIISWKAAY